MPLPLMTRQERHTTFAVALIYAIRMLGIFLFLPVLVRYALHLPGSGESLAAFSFAIFALVQAGLLIPFGLWSDRVGRKRVLYVGLALFATGNFLAALTDNIYLLIIARMVQGSGAISAALTAFLADATRETQRTKAMAAVGAAIGSSFAVALVAGPLLDAWMGTQRVFFIVGVCAIVALWLVRYALPELSAPVVSAAEPWAPRIGLRELLNNGQLLRLNTGAFILHAAQAVLFSVFPFILVEAYQLPNVEHWKVYLPTALGGFLVMVPLLFFFEKRRQVKRVYIGAIVLMGTVQLIIASGLSSLSSVYLVLTLYFLAFNLLEALLPSLVSKFSPVASRGAALGIQSTAQSAGFAFGAIVGGNVYFYFGIVSAFLICAVLMGLWAYWALSMRPFPLRPEPVARKP